MVLVISFLSLLSEAYEKATCPSIEVTLVLPSLILLLALTVAPYPIAVAFVRLFEPTFEKFPIATF